MGKFYLSESSGDNIQNFDPSILTRYADEWVSCFRMLTPNQAV